MPYFESKLKVDLGNLKDIKEKLIFCVKLGINNVILEPHNELKEIDPKIKAKIDDITSINIYYRINLHIESVKEFKKKIRFYNKCSEIISIESMIPEVLIHAARDTRVDIISFSNLNLLKNLSKGILSLVNQNNSFIEFTINSIMTDNKTYQSKAFRNLYRAIQLAINTKSNYIISGDFIELYDLRNPRVLASICHTILGLPLSETKKALSQNILSLIKRAQSRQNRFLFEEGVKLFKKD